MNNMLIKSQDGNFTGFVKYLGIGQRQVTGLIGDKLKEILKEKNITVDELIAKVGNSYRANIERSLEDKEIPKRDLVKKIVNKLKISDDYFEEDNLRNVIITDGNMVIAKYDTDDRAKEVLEELNKYIIECHKKGTPIAIEMPKE